MDEPESTPTPRQTARMRGLGSGLAVYASHHRHVSYRCAEDDAGRLADRLRRTLSAGDLADACFHGVPRGGLIVLAMLAYHLGLDRERLRPGSDDGSGRPRVLVDDCALSGLRLSQELLRLSGEGPVVVVHLYSTRELRRAVLDAEPRVTACVSAADLADLTARVLPVAEARAAWGQRWRRRLDDARPNSRAGREPGRARRYWLGIPELVSFAWNEPDRPFWNDQTGRVEDGWRFTPPHRCLKNRARLALDLPAEALRVEEPGKDWQLAEGVVWGEFDGVVWLLRGADQEVFSLPDSAALAWRALVVGAGAGGAAAALAAVYGIEAVQARRDVSALVAQLVAAGLLSEGDGQPTDD